MLGLPLTFALSQDQTLQLNLEQTGRSRSESTLTTRSPGLPPTTRPTLGCLDPRTELLPPLARLKLTHLICLLFSFQRPISRRCPPFDARQRGPCFYFSCRTASTKNFQKLYRPESQQRYSPGSGCFRRRRRCSLPPPPYPVKRFLDAPRGIFFRRDSVRSPRPTNRVRASTSTPDARQALFDAIARYS